jgi:tetratricopeptide (TPR) repeat protein
VGAAEVGRNALQRARTRAALADLRVRQGRLEEARQLLRGLDHQVETADARARLHLAQRELDLAAAVLRQALRDLGADPLRAAPLLQLLSEAEQQRGDRTAAATAVERLAGIAADVPLPCIRAQAALAQGRLAAHTDQAAAIAAFERGLTALTPGDWPLLRAALHLNLARSLSGTNRAAAIAEARAALAIFERIGAPEVEDASALLRGLGVAVRCSQSRRLGHSTSSAHASGRCSINSARDCPIRRSPMPWSSRARRSTTT